MDAMLILCWDIDGTLLTTGRAGIFAWQDAVKDVLGAEADLAAMNTSGLTDIEIAERLCEEFQGSPSPEAARALVHRYEELLPERLHLRKGKVLDGVVELLRFFDKKPGVVTMLLTGNTRAGARSKLTHYGLWEFFPLGAFADDGPGDRLAVARRAAALAEEKAGARFSPERMYVIGDTPHDIRCGEAIGARTVAVASGTYTIDQLGEHSPWWAVERLPEPLVFARKIGFRPPALNPPSQASALGRGRRWDPCESSSKNSGR